MSPGSSPPPSRTGIVAVHTHEGGKVCYSVPQRGRDRIEKPGMFAIGPFEPILCGYKPYTGQWYAYNPKTGREIATFTRKFFERSIEPARVGNLTPDPDCVLA